MCALYRNGNCRALTANCNGCNPDCSFYKTAEQVKKEQEAVNRRLRSLSLEHQDYIAEKYYGNKYPWVSDDGN